MTVSLDDGSSTTYVGCSGGSPLADAGKQYGYALSVSMSAWELLAGQMSQIGVSSNDDLIAQAAADLVANIQLWSNYALVPEVGHEQDTPTVVSSVATVLCVTQNNAQTMTCAELITAIGKASPLNVVTLTRTDPSAVRGTAAAATRGSATAAAAATNNQPPDWFQKLEDYLKTIGIGLGVALCVALVVVGLLVYRKAE